VISLTDPHGRILSFLDMPSGVPTGRNPLRLDSVIEETMQLSLYFLFTFMDMPRPITAGEFRPPVTINCASLLEPRLTQS
jgi:hypothetical protein